MKRRNFLKNFAVPFLSVCAPMVGNKLIGNNNEDAGRIFSQPELLSMLGDGQEVASIGRAYLRLFPNQRTEQELENLIRKRLGAGHSVVAPDRITQQVREDFSNGDTVLIRGWVLARTEAMQCALYFLTR